MVKAGIIDMTEGKSLPIIIRFSVPLILSAFFQQLYSYIVSCEIVALANPMAWFLAAGYCILMTIHYVR